MMLYGGKPSPQIRQANRRDYGRFPLPVSHTRSSRLSLPRSTALLISITILVLGLVVGAMLFGRALATLQQQSTDIELTQLLHNEN